MSWQYGPVTHIDNLVEVLWQIPVERIVVRARRCQDFKRQVARLDTATGRERQDLSSKPDADNRRTLCQRLPGQLDFLSQRRQVARPRRAPGSSSEKDQCIRGYCTGVLRPTDADLCLFLFLV